MGTEEMGAGVCPFSVRMMDKDKGTGGCAGRVLQEREVI